MPWWFITGMILSAILAVLFIGGCIHMVMVFLRKLNENNP